jgi:hypothetical protein
VFTWKAAVSRRRTRDDASRGREKLPRRQLLDARAGLRRRCRLPGRELPCGQVLAVSARRMSLGAGGAAPSLHAFTQPLSRGRAVPGRAVPRSVLC